MANRTFGKFASISEFLTSYEAAREAETTEAEKELPYEEKVQQRRSSLSQRAVVEVTATLQKLQEQGNELHLQLFVTLTALTQGDPTVNDDIQQVLASGQKVFVAVRIGDSEGITKPIVGLVDGVGLDLKGEWIPASKAFAQGGEKLPVLHFTHKPLGFICVDSPAACYS